MKLEVGMYVRTKHKGIVKINEVIENGVITYEDDFGREWEEETGRKVIRYIANDGWNCGLDEKEIIKASHNIIDLIEEGDLVTLNSKYCDGEIYQVVQKSDDIIGLDCFQDGTMYVDKTENDDIKSVLTKEQFESMSYKVEE